MHCLPVAPMVDLGDISGLWPAPGATPASSTAYRPFATPGPRAPPRLAPGADDRRLVYRLCVIRR
ncbi:hypothetical protein BST43_23630 [Mycobacteroides saopaulense]|uniref:Uncharacterized protein n=1 Tax=Mycobacteroides saopaulense TaxID=1578165 RepID=A0A1X0IMD4_9MYCO|nr:hypothetical protein BST43_23630 [Mycobacteroides saopaulense]